MPGLDGKVIKSIDANRATKRIAYDILSDFIISPHYSAIFKHASSELWDSLKKLLSSGEYNSKLPITIEVPKKSGITRPGSILNPLDRLLYQCLNDEIIEEMEICLDRDRVFSNILNIDEKTSGRMFEPASVSYGKLKNKLSELCLSPKNDYAIVTDIACYFERIYQHVLINLLRSTNCKPEITNLLERVLLSLTSKDSHGIVQGVYPSDALGNYYLSAFDAYLKCNEIEYIRYVDDYWMFFRTLEDAQKALVNICNYVRKEGLYLNEAKTKILRTDTLHYEETEIDQMFDNSREESRKWEFVFEEYTFEPFGIEIEQPENELKIQATEALYELRSSNPKLLEKIDKFCLPKFAINKSKIATKDAIRGLIERPHLSNIYARYLSQFLPEDKDILNNIEQIYINNLLTYEWQTMWVLGMFYHSDFVNSSVVAKSYQMLININVSPALRAICALVVSKHGDGPMRRLIRNHYSSEPSSYVKEAILYSTRFFPSNDDKNTCITTWSTHSEINGLIAIALKKEGTA